MPVAVGFGIATPEQAAAVGGMADGVIIGTRLVREVADAPDARAGAEAAGAVPARGPIRAGVRGLSRCRAVGEIGLDRIAAAHDAVSDQYERTPSLRIPAVDDLLGGPIRLKAENLQPSGSFKLRGVSSKLHSLGEEAERGVVAGTAGNHGRALAYAAQRRGVPCELFVPVDAPTSKTEPAAELGAKLTRCEGTVDDCVELARERADEGGLAFCHPFDDPDVIAGQGSVGPRAARPGPRAEPRARPARRRRARLRDRDRDPLAAPRGRGDRRAGRSCPSFPESIEAGEPVTVVPRNTVADGIAVKRPGELTMPLVEEWLAGVVVVERGRGRRRDGDAPRGREAGGRGSGRRRGRRARVGEGRAGARGHDRGRALGRQHRREPAGRDRAAQRRAPRPRRRHLHEDLRPPRIAGRAARRGRRDRRQRRRRPARARRDGPARRRDRRRADPRDARAASTPPTSVSRLRESEYVVKLHHREET